MTNEELRRGDRVRYTDRLGETHIAVIDQLDGDRCALSLDRDLGTVVVSRQSVEFFDRGRVVQYKPGDIVRSTKDAMSGDWANNGEARRRPWGLVCTVQRVHNSHGLTYEVIPRVAQIGDAPAIVPIIYYAHEELELYDTRQPLTVPIGRKPEW